MVKACTLTALRAEHIGADELTACPAPIAPGQSREPIRSGGQLLQPDEWPEEAATAVTGFNTLHKVAAGVSV